MLRLYLRGCKFNFVTVCIYLNSNPLSENELSDKDESETEASIQDLKDQKLKERIELEEKLSEEERLNRKKEAIDFKKTGNDLYLAGENVEAVQNYDQALDVCPLCYKVI